MSLNELDRHRVEHQLAKFCSERNQNLPVDLACVDYHLDTNSLYVTLSHWLVDGAHADDTVSVAKLFYDKEERRWHLFWRPSDATWQIYQPYPSSDQLHDLLNIISKDKFDCFWCL